LPFGAVLICGLVSVAYRPNSIFAVWDGIFFVYFSVFREFDTVPNAFFLIGTVWRRAFERRFRLFYTVPKPIFEVGTVWRKVW
jgi:hypothetical protein